MANSPIDIKLKKCKRAEGRYHHKSRFGQAKTKAIAMKDISEYEEHNYIWKEYLILQIWNIADKHINF